MIPRSRSMRMGFSWDAIAYAFVNPISGLKNMRN